MALENNGNIVTKNNDTKAAYLKRAKLLLSRYENNQKAPVSDQGFIDWLIHLKPTISTATWRQYKAAVVWYLEAQDQFEVASILKETNNEGCKNIKKFPIKKRKTSAKKKKSVTRNEEESISKYLQDTAESKFWARPTLAFFKAILATGLRPDEWQSSILIKSQDNNSLILKVQNSKATNGRAHGKYRHLHLINLTNTDLLYVRIAIQYANPRSTNGWLTPSGKAESWQEYYKYLQSHFYRATGKLFPTESRRVTIYSCRHQFIANLKKAKYTKEEIAALVGHGTDETATEHYGRTKFGRSRKGLPKPDIGDVNNVRLTSHNRPTKAPTL